MRHVLAALLLLALAAACARESRDAARTDPLPDSVRAALVELGRQDQLPRTDLDPARMADTLFARELLRGDSVRTARLRALVERYGWPEVSRAGADAANAAFLVLQHSPDVAFQRELVGTLEALAERGEASRQDVAMLVDRVLLHDDRPQRYGTQFRLVDGKWVMHPVEEEAGLDARRASMGLPPMDEYMRMMQEFYGAPVVRE